MATIDLQSAKRIGVVSTVVDAAFAFARGRKKSGLVLLGAAALSSRVPGLGAVVSVFLRVVRWVR